MVPKEQLDAFVLTISEAFGCAAEGRVPRGYLLLRDGLCTAQESATEWTPELTALWQAGLQRFKTRFPADWYPPDPALDSD
jgi:hypothetical protein